MKVTTLMLGPIATNCYVVEPGDGSCIVLDISEEIGKLTAYLEANALTVSAILLTHGHYDHIGGVARIQKAYQAPVYVHAADAAMLTSEKESMATWLANQPFDPVTNQDIPAAASVINVKMCCFPEIPCSAFPEAEPIFRAEAMQTCCNP